jgi:hypothetical protein
VRADGLTSVIPSAQSGIPGDLSAISIGDFVGVDGAVAQDQAFTVDATLVRDWTTNPFTGSDFAPAPGIEGASTGTSDVSLPQSTEDVSTEPAPLSQSLDGDTSMEDESGTATTTDGADTATEEPTDESDLTYRGSVDSVDSDANTFTFTDDFDSTYTVNVDQNTSVVNNDDEIISLEDVAEGDRVDVEGAVDGNDITATFIRNIDDTSGLFF